MNRSDRCEWDRWQEPLERQLPGFLSQQRWFGGKTRVIRNAEVIDFLPIPIESAAAAIHLVRIGYQQGAGETYAVPLADRADAAGEYPALRIPRERGGDLVLSDAMRNRQFLAKLLELLASAAHVPGKFGEMAGLPTPALEELRRAASAPLDPAPMNAEQSNTSILYGRSFALKFFRHVVEGVNPDFEMGEFLTMRAGFRHVPAAAGAFEYRRPGAAPATVGILQEFVPNRGDAWRGALAALDDFYGRVEGGAAGLEFREGPGRSLVAEARQPAGDSGLWLGEYGEAARRLGRRTGELHLALCSDADDREFRPEPFTREYEREIGESMKRLAREALSLLERRVPDLPGALGEKARAALAASEGILARFERLRGRELTGLRTRIHGDLHLGQILDTGGDFVFIDFEGEPARSLAERRAKHSPLRDVAGMLRSFHYAAYAALPGGGGEGETPGSRPAPPARYADDWRRRAGAEFLRGYLEAAGGANCLPAGADELEFLVNLWQLDKAMYELKYELNHRLNWVRVPLEGICELAAGP